MRFVWAVAAFVLAAVMIGAGIAQRTVFQGPKYRDRRHLRDRRRPVSRSSTAMCSNKLPGAQTLRAQGDGEIFAAYGRTADMQAWLADTTYNEVTVSRSGKVVVGARRHRPSPTNRRPRADATPRAPEPDASAKPEERDDRGAAAPIGSDLWLDEFQQDGSADRTRCSCPRT